MAVRIENTAYFNVCDVEIGQRDGQVEVAFAADPHGGPECLWFCFRLRRGAAEVPPRTILRLKYCQTMLGGGSGANLRPVIRYVGETWRRLDAPEVRPLPDGQVDVLWTIDTPRSFADIAYCYPYGREEVEAVARDGGWRTDAIGVSQLGRPIVRLANDYGEPESPRPGVYVLARQHSSETSGSWLLDGFLRRIAAMKDQAPLVWAVPLSNIDGVEQGDYGKDNFPYDLNRAWGRPPMRHETLVIRRDIVRWRTRCRPALALDSHSPGAAENTGVYGYLPNPERLPEAHAAMVPLTERIQRALGPEFSSDPFGRVATYASRWQTPNFIAGMYLDFQIPGLSLETPYALVGQRILTIEDYQTAGARLADAVAEHCASVK